jgi:hypothetical protein
MRNTSRWIAASLAIAVAGGCKAKESAESKPPESNQADTKPAGGTVPADAMGTFTCKHIQDERADGSNSPCIDSTDHFEATVPVVHVTYRTLDLPKSGDVYVIQWIATDVGQAAPANTVIATVNYAVGDIVAGGKNYTVNSYMTKPTNGWPLGTYRVEVKLGDKLVTTAHFAIQ